MVRDWLEGKIVITHQYPTRGMLHCITHYFFFQLSKHVECSRKGVKGGEKDRIKEKSEIQRIEKIINGPFFSISFIFL
jgi:hypothetical protein